MNIESVTQKESARFWKYVQKQDADACWPWTGSRVGRGYGRLGFYRNKSLFVMNAHRVSWVMHHGLIPEGMFVCHACDNPPCVNPAHLFLGTASDNAVDAAIKGRLHLKPRREFEAHEVADIRRRYAAGESRASIALSYGAIAYQLAAITRGLGIRRVKGEPASRQRRTKSLGVYKPRFAEDRDLMRRITAELFDHAEASGLSILELARRMGATGQHLYSVRLHGIATMRMLGALTAAMGLEPHITFAPKAVTGEKVSA